MLKKIFLLLIVGFISIFVNPCLAQSIDKNDLGESIVVYPDGSWRHFDANNPEDQQLMRAHLQAMENAANNPPPTKVAPPEFEVNPAANIAKNAAELEAIILKAIDKEQDAVEEHDLAVKRKATLQNRLERLRTVDTPNKSQIKSLKEQLNNASDAERIAQKKRNEASKDARKYEKIALMDPAQQEKALDNIRAKEAALALDNISVVPDVDTALAKAEKEKKAKKQKSSKSKKVKTKKPKKKKKAKKAKTNQPKKKKGKKAKTKKQKQKKQKDSAVAKTKKPKKKQKKTPVRETPSFGKTVSSFKQLGPEDDVILNPPTPNCVIAYEGVDNISGKKRKDVAPAHFFSYTNDNLRKLFKDKDMIECSGHLTSVSGGLKYLSVEIIIHDEKALQNYGLLEKNSIFSMRLVNGTTIQLLNSKTSQGNLNRFEKYVTYNAQYRIGPDQEKALLKTEIDRVRVVWSTGYEEYEVFETDFMMYQLRCLNQ